MLEHADKDKTNVGVFEQFTSKGKKEQERRSKEENAAKEYS